jgi:hypothetical protein
LINTSLRPYSAPWQRLRPGNYLRLLRLLALPASARQIEEGILSMTSRRPDTAVVDRWVALRPITQCHDAMPCGNCLRRPRIVRRRAVPVAACCCWHRRAMAWWRRPAHSAWPSDGMFPCISIRRPATIFRSTIRNGLRGNSKPGRAVIPAADSITMAVAAL